MTDFTLVKPTGKRIDLAHVKSEREETLSKNRMTTCRIQTTRTSLADSGTSIEAGDDWVFIYNDSGTATFGGVVRERQRGHPRVGIIADSFERLAMDAEPAPAEQTYDSVDDTTVVNDAIDGTDGLTAGTVTNVKSSLSFTFNHASQALKIRDVRQAAGADVKYNPNRTVDYVSSLGSDQTGGDTIDPENQNVTAARTIDEAGEAVANHLRVIGGDNTSVDVTASTFDAQTDRERWRRAYFSSVTDTSTLTELGNELLADLDETWTKVELTLTDLSPTPSIGDTYTVNYAEEDITNTDLRIVDLTTIRDHKGTHWQATLSNRSEALKSALEKLGNLTRTPGGVGQGVVASGAVTLSGGSAEVDLGVTSDTHPASFGPFLAPSTNGAEVAADIFASAGSNYILNIEETDTSVGNPTVFYDVLRVR